MGPNFKVQGKLHHLLGPIGPPAVGQTPKFAQLYFHDADHETENRLSHVRTKLKPEILRPLQEMLHDINPYVQSFKSALDILTREADVRIVLVAKKSPDSTNPGCYNLPSGSEVAVLMPGDQVGELDVVLHHKEGGLKRINSMHRSYDPVHYVLLLPEGQDGFSPGLTNTEGKPVSVNQFYAFHLQVSI